MNNTMTVSFETNAVNKYVQPKKEYLEFSADAEINEYARFENHIFYETYSIFDELNIVISAFDKIVLEKFGNSIPR